METPPLSSGSFPFNDHRQKRIYEDLKVLGPGLADFFHDACCMMANPGMLRGTSHYVAHCLREIESALRKVLLPVASEGQSTKEGSKEDFPQAEQKGEGVHKKQIQQIVALFEPGQRERILRAWFNLADSLHRLVHRLGLEGLRPVEEIQDLWKESLDWLEVILQGIREVFFLKWFPILDEMLKKPQPKQEDIKKLANEIPNNRILRNYFFQRLEHREWLKPLWEECFFKRPAPAVRDEDGVRFLNWDEAKYLARMAKYEPKIVYLIIRKMEDTDNVLVHHDLLEAALAMPVELSARLWEKVKKWVEMESPYHFFPPDKIGKLIVGWLKGGKTKEALDMARVLLDVSPAGEGAALQARFNGWYYEQILKNYYPELIQEIGLPALHLLCDILEKAVRSSYPQNKEPEDHSDVWRPAIEDHPQNFPLPTLKDVLVSGVRDGAELKVRSGKAIVEEVVKVLEQRKWKIFQRIALHILRIFADQDEQVFPLIEERLTDRKLFYDWGVWHEYTLLLRKCFSTLSEGGRAQILSWIEDRSGGEEEQLDQLARIGPENLPAEWRKRYEELRAKYCEPPHPEFLLYSQWVKDTSPKTKEELKETSVPEIVDFLRRWEPPAPNASFRGETPRKLAKELCSVVSEEPERFASEAMQFQGLKPIYIRAFLCGLGQGLEHLKVFDWDPVLDLCHWVLEQPREIPGRQVEGIEAGIDWGDWGETRKEIADLLNKGFSDSPASIPFELREKVWDILQPLTEDPEPTPEYEEKYGGPNMDPVNLSINTTRGKAMHAVISYALWVRRHLEKQVDALERIRRGFEEMPEVREVLEKHLDVSREPSLAIRSVYGEKFPQLVHLDAKWAQENAERIFPMAPDQEVFFETAWNTYVVSWRHYPVLSDILWNPYVDSWYPGSDLFDILQEQYHYAVERIGKRRSHIQWPGDPDKSLAEHLMVFYCWGKISLEDPLLRSFWGKAPDDLRSYVMRFIGQWFGQQPSEEIPPEIIDRLKQLWKFRLAEAQKSPTDFVLEMFAFNWWIASGKFDTAWAIDRLWESLDVISKVEPADRRVDKRQFYDVLLLLEILAENVEAEPEKSVEYLDIIIKSSSKKTIHDARKVIEKILKVGLQKPCTCEKAKRLINYLVSCGFLNFRNLLDGKIEN